MKQISYLLYPLIVAACLLCSSCGTVRGFGEDISGSANFVQKKMCGEDSVPPAAAASNNPPQWPK